MKSGGGGAILVAHAQTTSPLNVTISLDSEVTDPTNLDTIPFTISFSKPVPEFELASVVTSSGVPQDLVFELTPYARFTTPHFSLDVATNSTGHIFTISSHGITIWDSDYNLLANPVLGLSNSHSIAINATDHIFVTNSSNIAVYDSSLNLVDNFNDDDNPGGSRIPTHGNLAFNSTGYLYYTASHRILVFDRAGDFVDRFDGYSFSNHKSIAFNSTGHIFVADFGHNRIRIYDGNLVHQGDISGIIKPQAISIDSLDNIYISHSYGNSTTTIISIYDSENNLQDTYQYFSCKSFVYISVSICGENNLPEAYRQFGFRLNTHIDKTTDLLYVTDPNNGRIQIFDTKNGTFNVINPDNGLLTVTVPANAVTDIDGSTNTAPSNTVSVTVTELLTVSLSLGDGVTDPTSLDEIPFTVSFNKPISEFELSGVTTSSGTPQDYIPKLTPHARFNANLTSANDDPYSVATNATGHIFTLHSLTSSIKIWDSNYTLLANTTMGLHLPLDMALNATGHIFVANSDGDILVYDGSLNLVDNFNDDDNPGGSRISATSGGLAFNSTGFLYFANFGGNHILVFDSTGNIVDEFGVRGFGDDPYHLSRPSDISFNSTGHIFVADFDNNRIRIYDSNHVHQGDISGGPSLPLDIEIDSLDNIYISKILGNRIFIYNSENNFLGTYGSRGAGSEEFNEIGHMDIDEVTGLLYIADNVNGRIQILDTKSATFNVTNSDNGVLGVTIPANAITDIDGLINTAPSNTASVIVDRPLAVTLSLGDSVTDPTSLDTIPFTVSFNRPISEFELSSDVVTSSGVPQDFVFELTPYARFTTNTPLSQDFRLRDHPFNVVTNATGHIFTVHPNSNNLKIWDSNYTLLANTTVGLDGPTGIALNATGHIFVANNIDRVRGIPAANSSNIVVYDSSLNIVDTFNDDDNHDGSRISSYSWGLAFNSTGYLYLVDARNHHILVFDRAGDIVDEFGVYGRGNETSHLYFPNDISFNSTGHIFITDTLNDRIRIYDGNHVHQGDISGNLFSPQGVTIDSLDNIYISIFRANHISIYDSENNFQGTYGSSGSGIREFRSIPNIHIDKTTDLLYVADVYNNRIQIINTKSGTFNVTNPDTGLLTVTVPVNAVTGTDGLNNTAPSTASVTVDRPIVDSPLAVTLSLGDGITDPTTLDEIPFTVSFDKPISEFELASITTSSGTPQDYIPKLTPHARFNANLTSANDDPYSVATNATGHIFTLHSLTSSIKIWDSNYTLLANTTMGLHLPLDMALNATGHIFVANSDGDILVYDGSLNLVDNFNDDDNPGGSRISATSGGLAFNSTGFLYFANFGGNHILVFDHTGNIVDEFGVRGFGDDPYHLSRPSDISFNSTGHIFVADFDNNRIRIYDSNHVHQGDISGGPSLPLDIEIDSLDNIYISKILGNRIFIYNSENNFLGTYGSRGAGSEEFNEIGHMDIDENTGLLYIADNVNGRIQILDTKSGTFNVTNSDNGILDVTVPANAITDIDGVPNTAPSNTVSVTVTESLLAVSLSLGDGVTDPTSLDEIPFTVSFSKPILEFELDSVVTSSGVSQDYMPKLTPYSRFNAQFTSANDSPFGVTTNATGHIFTAHPYNNYVKIWDHNYTLLANTTMGLEHPTDIELNATGHIFVANAHSIAVYDDSLNLVDTFDDLDNSRISEVSGGLAFNSTGYLYLADRNGHHILVFDSAGNIVDEFGVYGRGNETSHLYFPNDVSFNSTGHIFVADDGNNRIRIYDGNHVYQGDIVGNLAGPRGVTIDSLDNIYISEHLSHRISIYDSENNLQGIYGSRGSGNDNFISPDLLNIDYNTGLLYLADSDNGRIQILDTKNGVFTVVNATSDDTLTVRVSANAATDSDGLGNPVPSNTISVRIDTTAPVLDVLVPELDLITGTLTFDFGDTIDVSEISLDGIAITDRNGENPITLAGATTPDTDSDVITITLTNTQYANIFKTYLNNGPVQLDVAPDAIPNMFGIHFAGFNDVSLVLSFAVSRAPVPVAVSAIDDDADLALDRVISADTIVIDGDTYTVAASNRENGIQIINITDPATPIPVSAFVNGTDSSYLVGPWSVTTSIINDTPYALVASNGDNGGFVIIDMSNPANPTLASERTDGQDGFDNLRQARAISTVDIGGVPYALVGSNGEDSIHVVDVSDPTDPDVVSTITHGVDNFLLDGPRSISHVTISGTPYAIVASFGNHTQIIDMSDPGNPLAVSHLVDDASLILSKPRSVDTVVIDDNTYAVVASQGDNGIQIINITTPASPDAISSVVDDTSLALESARYITTTSIDGNTYAVVAGRTDNGVQIIDISDPANPIPVSSVFDGMNGFTELQGASSISVISIDDVTYAVVASIDDNGIQIVDITSTDTTISVDGEALQCIVP